MPKRYKKYKLSEHKIAVITILILTAVMGVLLLIQNSTVALLSPKGIVAQSELKLIGIAIGLMLIVALPLLVMGFTFARKYREDSKQTYAPTWDSPSISFALWAIPAAVITILAFVTWHGTHALDPYKKLNAQNKPMTIQVVALQWKWLFIYPDQNIATVNFVEFPEKTPINFELTADAPMNSFWIPELGGQIYAMSGMATHLNLMADATGEFQGSAAEISGAGFASMRFVAKSTSRTDFADWVTNVKGSTKGLSANEYEQLAKPNEGNYPATYYAAVQYGIFDDIMKKYMPAMPAGSHDSMHGMGM
jgi:cytochrome o ubiquinol oxidase subunit 2